MTWMKEKLQSPSSWHNKLMTELNPNTDIDHRTLAKLTRSSFQPNTPFKWKAQRLPITKSTTNSHLWWPWQWRAFKQNRTSDLAASEIKDSEFVKDVLNRQLNLLFFDIKFLLSSLLSLFIYSVDAVALESPRKRALKMWKTVDLDQSINQSIRRKT